MNTTIAENEISYVLSGDYYLPLITLNETETSPVGRWGQMRRTYLKEHCRGRYTSLLLTGRLASYLADLDAQAEERFVYIVEQMKKAESITEALKRQNVMLWVQCCNNIRNRAEEIVLEEFVYCK